MATASKPNPQTIRFTFPFRDAKGKELVDEHMLHDWLANEQSGSFAVSRSGMWHGGIHISSDGAGAQLDLAHGVRCLADGEVVAYRINRAPLVSRIPEGAGQPAQVVHYSSAFTLVRHTLEYPTENRLTFFSLYMHLQSVSEYEQQSQPQSQEVPAYWARSYEVTRHASDRPKADRHHGAAPASQVGLNIHAVAAGSERLGILPRGARVRIGETSGKGRWGRIEAIESGEVMAPKVASFVHPGADRGWVYLAKEHDHLLLEPRVSLARCDQVVVPARPMQIKAGELIGHLGPYWKVDDPARAHRMVHLEVFCGEELPRFLSQSRAAARKDLDLARRTLLRIDKGVKLFADPAVDREGAHAPETAVVQIYNQAALEALPADRKGPKDDAFGDGQPWWRVTSANSRHDDISGWAASAEIDTEASQRVGEPRRIPEPLREGATASGQRAVSRCGDGAC
jgi:hypothetical protein